MTETIAPSEDRRPRRTSLLSDFSSEQFDPINILRMLWRRKWLVAGSVILFIALALTYLSQVTPIYTASTSLMLDTRQKNVVDVENVLSGLNVRALSSEVQVIRSSQLIGRVVDKLRLERDPEFNPRLRALSFMQQLKQSAPAQSLKSILVDAGLAKPAQKQALSESENNYRLRAGIIAAVQGRLSVEQLPRTVVLSVRFRSQDPKKAALLANAIADQYLNDQLEVKYDATRRASSWLTERLDDLKSQVEKSEAAVEAFKAQQVSAAGQGAGLTAQQMTQINAELINARSKRSEAEARYNQLNNRLKAGDPLAAAEILSSPGVARLRETQAELKREEAELSARYFDRHPKMVKIRAEIQDVENGLRNEIEKVVQNLRGELAVSRSRERSLQQSLRELESRAVKQNQASVGLRQLEREAEANRSIYENFLSRFKETTAQEDIQDADVRVISRAEIPGGPSSPRRQLILAGAVILGFIVGSGLVILLELMNNGFRSPADVEGALGLVTLGSVPMLRGGGRKRRDVLDYVVNKPVSALAESFRSLRTSLLLSNVDNPPQVVLVTSSIPGEGKSTTSLLLARTSVALGRKVVIVDCDLRRSTIHDTIGISNDASVVDVLAGRMTLEEAIYTDEISGLDIMPAKPTAASSIDLLSSEHFQQLVETLRDRYDMVILDSAPILAVSDALVVGNLADAVLYIVKWDDTPKAAVSNGIQSMLDANLKIAGVVLNQIDMKKSSSYGEYGTYYGKYTEYYQN